MDRKAKYFTLSVESLRAIGLTRPVEPAAVQLMVGKSSQNLPLQGSFELIGEKCVVRQRTHYFCGVDVSAA
jgi:hypothetical protein